MRYLRLLFFVLVLFCLANSAFAFVIGVAKPSDTCIKPDRTGFIEVHCDSGASSTYEYEASASGISFASMESNTYLFLPKSGQDIPIFLNTSKVAEGYYNGTFMFCPSAALSENNESQGVEVVHCISVIVNVNVSSACPELPAGKQTDSSANEGMFSWIFKSPRMAFNIFASVLILILLAVVITKNILKKRHKN
ncbi:MAG: hypothetical protein PHH61_04180 [Candidatus Nanoarchaeia archaeon]|nr:hypothetical protein [Candidatus Nanoarchaeia archaeon]